MSVIYRMDFAINDWIVTHLSSPFFDVFWQAITFLGDAGWFWIALTVLFLCFKKTRSYGIAMAISLLISTLLTNVILKPLINRPRPWTLREIDIKVDLPSDASFPSGHTTASFSAAFSLFWQNKKAGAPALVLAALIAFSRLYFYLHYPTDVLGGFLIGLLASLASRYLLPLAERGLKRLSTMLDEIRKAKRNS